jgi:Rha family phage regulatory protein
MNELNVIAICDHTYIDSRDVAKAIGKLHHHLLRDIRGYARTLEKIGLTKSGSSDFFMEGSYLNAQNKEMPCYLITKMGCDMIANKLTGDKGVMFTAAYVRKFEEMRKELDDLHGQGHRHVNRASLSGINAAVRNILRGMSDTASPAEVEDFLRSTYQPLGIMVTDHNDVKGTYMTAAQIAGELGILSRSLTPHANAVSAIINKLAGIEGHIAIVPYNFVGMTVRYDYFIVDMVWDWLLDNGFPGEIPHGGFNYHIFYYGFRGHRTRTISPAA